MPVVLEEEEGEQLEEEEEGLLLLDSSSPPERRRQQQPPAIRWDRIVTAGLGVMGALIDRSIDRDRSNQMVDGLSFHGHTADTTPPPSTHTNSLDIPPVRRHRLLLPPVLHPHGPRHGRRRRPARPHDGGRPAVVVLHDALLR